VGSGVEIYEYQTSYLHASAVVTDHGNRGFFQYRSIQLAAGARSHLAVQHTGLAGELRASLFAAIAQDAVRVGDKYDLKRN